MHGALSPVSWSIVCLAEDLTNHARLAVASFLEHKVGGEGDIVQDAATVCAA